MMTVPDAFTTGVSPLEALHPSGPGRRAVVLGSACPAALRPTASAGAGSIDLAVIAPDHAELRSAGWLADAVATAQRRLSKDGMLFALVPPRSRWMLRRRLSRQGWRIDPPLALLPGAEASRHLVQVHATLLRYALTELIPIRPRLRRAVRLAARLPGSSAALAALLPGIGLVARRPGATPAYTWLLGPSVAAGVQGITTRSWRTEREPLIIHSMNVKQAVPLEVAKVATLPAVREACRNEAVALEALAPVAGRAGFRVPRLLGCEERDTHITVHQSVVGGEPLSAVLRASPRLLSRVLTQLQQTLQRWALDTGAERVWCRADLDAEILAPARLLAADLENTGSDYLVWLETRCDEVEGSPLLRVSVHQDLTMSNVLWDRDGALGLVDWEAARADGLPLVDFVYAAVDAALHVGDSSRADAVRQCFADRGLHASSVRGLLERLRAALALAPPVAELCFHACWLHHAVNEQRSTPAGAARPFLEALQAVATGAVGDGEPWWTVRAQ